MWSTTNILLILALSVLVVAWEERGTDPVQSDRIIQAVNSEDRGWIAGKNKRFESLTIDEAKYSLGLSQQPVVRNETIYQGPNTNPTSFDGRTKWPDCFEPIKDQSGCGGCWAFASSSTFAIRACIASKGAINKVMSAQDPISCDTGNHGCNGGTLGGVWSYYVNTGIVADEDYPFTSGNGDRGTCKVDPKDKRYYAVSYTQIRTGMAAMQTEIINNGPIQVGFDVYTDFFSYKSGVYTHVSGSIAGGHSVYLVGWGVDSAGTKYWIAINSWGTSWGNKGTFLIKRGNNECNIETGYAPVAGFIKVDPASAPTTAKPTTTTTKAPTAPPTTQKPTTTTAKPTTAKPTSPPTTTAKPTVPPTTAKPTSPPTTTAKPTNPPTTTAKPTTTKPPTNPPTTAKPTSPPTTAKPTSPPTTTAKPTSPPTTKPPTTTPKPTPLPPVTTCPPIPTNCPCGVILPEGASCKRCKINCPVQATASPDAGCPDGWKRAGASCFIIPGQQLAWDDAQGACELLGAYLAEIDSAEENDFVLNNVSPNNKESAWIGCSIHEGRGIDLFGNLLPYTNWKDASQGEGCGAQIRDPVSTNLGRWKTKPCTLLASYVCQKQATN